MCSELKNKGCDYKMYYSIISSKHHDGISKQITMYGIKYNDGNQQIAVADITSDLKKLKGLVTLCNNLELDVSQLYEVIEDFLSE